MLSVPHVGMPAFPPIESFTCTHKPSMNSATSSPSPAARSTSDTDVTIAGGQPATVTPTAPTAAHASTAVHPTPNSAAPHQHPTSPDPPAKTQASNTRHGSPPEDSSTPHDHANPHPRTLAYATPPAHQHSHKGAAPPQRPSDPRSTSHPNSRADPTSHDPPGPVQRAEQEPPTPAQRRKLGAAVSPSTDSRASVSARPGSSS